MDPLNFLKILKETKTTLNEALENTDMKDWEIVEVKLTKKGSKSISSRSCQVFENPDGSIVIVC